MSPTVDVRALAWKKSSFSDYSCVETAPMGDGRVAFRDSKDPEGAVLVFEGHEIGAFLAGVRNGEFDYLVP